jgi:hypothetical protein
VKSATAKPNHWEAKGRHHDHGMTMIGFFEAINTRDRSRRVSFQKGLKLRYM